MSNNQNRGRSSISIAGQTKQALDSIKHAGQSYDGLIQELVEFWKEKNKKEHETRDRE